MGQPVVYTLFGESLGRLMMSSWNWLCGRPLEEGGTMSVQIAEQALRDIAGRVDELTQAVSTQMASFKRAKDLFEQKTKEHDDVERAALTAHAEAEKATDDAERSKFMEMAEQAMRRVLAIEEVIPQLKERVERAQSYAQAAHDNLREHQGKLEDYKSTLQNMKDMNEINQALEAMEKVSSENKIDSAKNQFDVAKNAVEKRTLKTEAYQALSENPSEKASRDLKKLSASTELERRMKMLGQPTDKKLLGDGNH
jgi:phage shock protein A